MSPRRRRVMAVPAGVLLGLGVYTFQYAKGLSYFSSTKGFTLQNFREPIRIKPKNASIAAHPGRGDRLPAPGQTAALKGGR